MKTKTRKALADFDRIDRRAIARLRESKTDSEATPITDGKCAGKDYVLKYATWTEMKKLESFHVTGSESIDLVAFAIRGYSDWRGLVNMMRREYGTDINHPSWIKRFIEDAIEKFRELDEEVCNAPDSRTGLATETPS